jgi:hypothetical protein
VGTTKVMNNSEVYKCTSKSDLLIMKYDYIIITFKKQINRCRVNRRMTFVDRFFIAGKITVTL